MGFHFIVNFGLGMSVDHVEKGWKRANKKSKLKHPKPEETRKERSWKIWISQNRVKSSRFEHANPALVLNPQVLPVQNQGLVDFWWVATCWTDSRTPAYFWKTVSPKELVQVSGMTKKKRQYIFKAPKIEFARLTGCTESLSQPLYLSWGGYPSIKRLVFWSLTYLILYCR